MLMRRDVRKAREHLDFSAWAGSSTRRVTANEIQDICDAVSDGSMLPLAYRLMHPEARLSDSDKNSVCDWADQARSPEGMRTTQPAEKNKPTS